MPAVSDVSVRVGAAVLQAPGTEVTTAAFAGQRAAGVGEQDVHLPRFGVHAPLLLNHSRRSSSRPRCKQAFL